MSIKNASKLFFGSIFVYVAMASCVASERATMSSAATTGANGAGGSGGSMVAGNGGMGGILDPVPDAGAETSGSGTRLKARRYVAEDGANTAPLSYWYDSKREEDCYFQGLGGGTIRCAPLSAYEPFTYYTDASCTTEALGHDEQVSACGTHWKYVHTYITNGCSSIKSIHEVGAELDPNTMWVKLADNSCAAYPASPMYKYYAVGLAIPPTEFVAATLVTDP